MLVSYGLKLAVLLPVLGEHNGSQAHLKAGVATVPLRGRLLGCVLKKLAFCTLGRWHRWTSSWNWSDQCSRNPEHTYPLWSLRNEYWMMPPSTRGLLMMLQFTSWSWHQLDKTLPHLNPVLWRKCKCFPSAEKRGPVEKIEMLLPVWLKHCLCLGWCFLFCLFVLGFFIWGPPPPPFFFVCGVLSGRWKPTRSCKCRQEGCGHGCSWMWCTLQPLPPASLRRAWSRE